MELTYEQLEQLNGTFEQGNVPQKDRDFWISRFQNVSPEIGEDILSLFVSLPNEINRFTDLQKQKEKALAKGDEEAWEKILKEEHARLPELISIVSNIKE